ncbi:asparagine synthase-related protein [Ornithinibacillus californiensis]|uniref:asparagine synthase-related protein n=1 Tax=Ornithinibacillus californiensis TaxID=161536 RepID=UPI0007ED04EA|nr:asparagine synthase-related protein [Ornithinibacillus californiensis]
MSAIVGVLQSDKRSISCEVVHKMMEDLQKYPSDDSQVWTGNHVFLGCHHQWITPESIGERLPYVDGDRQLAITADAIIDNRSELFEKLQIEMADRKYITDSQLLLLGYDKWKEELPKHLVGDFAFMIWDEKEQRLFGARDFSGARTLYYTNNSTQFAFCTVIHPLFLLPNVSKKINDMWLAEYLAIPNMIDAIDVSQSVFEDINQVPPAHSITVKNGRVTISRYCTLEAERTIRYKKDSDYVEAFQEIFKEAVDARLRSAFPVGAQLSGGLDSGSVVSFAAHSLRKENKILHTFSSIPEEGFEDWTPRHRMADERPFMKETEKYVGNIHANYLSFNGKNPYSEIDGWLEMMEMPYKFFENSVWVKGFSEKAQESGIRVMLNGARGNFGISWGRALDYHANLLRRVKWMTLYREMTSYSKNMDVDNSRVFSIIFNKAFRNARLEGYRLPEIINAKFARRTDIYRKLEQYDFYNKPKGMGELRKQHFREPYMWNATGTSNTKLSMKYSLWHRDPTNDYRVIQYCLSLPEEQFVQQGLDRALIRRATMGFLPDKVRLNQRVRGIQGVDWVQRVIPEWGKLQAEVQELIQDPVVSNYLDTKVVKQIADKYRMEPSNNQASNPELRILMRIIILYRFLKNIDLKGGGIVEERMEAAGIRNP